MFSCRQFVLSRVAKVNYFFFATPQNFDKSLRAKLHCASRFLQAVLLLLTKIYINKFSFLISMNINCLLLFSKSIFFLLFIKKEIH